MSKKASSKKEMSKTEKSKKLTVLIIVLSVILAIVIAGIVAVYFIFDFGDDVFVFEQPTAFVDDIEGHTNENGEEIGTGVNTLNDLRSSDSLSTALKEWAVGEDSSSLMSSKNVINFLLVGVDESGCNSDVIMLLSLNKNTGKIYLTSVMRDCYTYINTAYGDRYAKINASYANGGAKTLIETLQNDFKIKIDHYVLVNFKSFKLIVDTMGGVNVPVQQYEAAAIASDCPYGDNVTLNGEYALTYCRIRHCDSDGDVSRTRRQRQFITSIIQKTKEISFSQVSQVFNTLMKYVTTDCSTSDLISFATQALLNKWYAYDIEQQTMPSPDFRMDYMGYAWVWIVDYPGAANYLQTQIYGSSNIELTDDRITAIDIMKTGNSGNANP